MITDDLADLIRTAVLRARDAGEFAVDEAEIPPLKLETPKNKQHGDYSSNIALALKKATGVNDSRQLADSIVKHLPENALIDHADIAGPGFLNFYLKPDWLHETLLQIEAKDACYGTNATRTGERILVEFVSANPTGPISVVNGRAAALGDTLANLLASQGCEVGREFYINDALNSTQLDLFGYSVYLRYLQLQGAPILFPPAEENGKWVLEPGDGIDASVLVFGTKEEYDGLVNSLPTGNQSATGNEAYQAAKGTVSTFMRQPKFNLPENPLELSVFFIKHLDALKKIGNPLGFPADFPKNGYRGEYVKQIAREILVDVGAKYNDTPEAERTEFFRNATLHRMVASQRAALEAFGLNFDTWYFESSLYEKHLVEQTIAHLKERGYAYEKDGALWLQSTAFGDDKDRVLIRSNEKATYIAADAAYHDDKFRRGWTKLTNIWGADHHGYVSRLKAGVAALGYDPKNLEIILTQMVSLVRDGEAIVGGKRKGAVIELKEDLIDEIGKDAARFYFLLNSYETPATVDVELARKQSNDNPVYYVQYAHARLCSVLRKAEEQGFALQPASETRRDLLIHAAELDVLRKLADYPQELTTAANDYAPHRLTRYAMEMASLLNIFYENCRVLPGKDDPLAPELTTARLALVNGARIVLRNLLTMLGISAPDKM